MSDSTVPRVILLTMNKTEVLALANCASLGFNALVTGKLDESVYMSAARSLRSMTYEEWNDLQQRLMSLISTAFPEIKVSSTGLGL